MSRLAPIGRLEESTEGKVKLYAERIKDSFQDSMRMESVHKGRILAAPSVQRLREKHNLLLFSNLRKEQQLHELQAALQALSAANLHTSSDRDLTQSARSAELSDHSGPFLRLNFLKQESFDLEQKTEKEKISQDQLVYVIKKTKEKITHIKHRIAQVTRFKDKVLKDAPKVTTLHAQSMNDLTHSVYVLQKRKENYRDQREKHTTSLRMQKDVSQKTAGDNEEMVANFARTEVLKEEGFFRTQKIINELQEKIRLEKERKAQLNKQELAALKFHKSMSTLERYPPFSLMRNSAIHRFEGVFSTDSLITHYHTLITQEQHLNTRYLELTETEANLLNKLKRLQVDLEELVVGYFDYTELNKALKVAGGLGPTQNLMRLRVEECMDGRSIEQEHVEHEEMIQGYLLLFFLELKGKLSWKLVQLHGMLKEDYLLPEWKRMQRKGSMYGVLGLEETVGLSPVLQRLCNDVPPLKLNTTPEDIKSVVEDSQLTTVNAFTKLLAAAGQHFSEKLAFTLSDISSILSQLPTHTSRTLQELDRLSLAPDHFRAYIRSLPAPLQVQTTAAETPVSPLIQSLLEFRLTHIPTTDHQEEFDTFITQFSQGNIKNTLSSERLPESRQSKAASSEASDLGRLLLKSGSEDKKTGKHRINNSRNYEQTLLTAVAETESRIKEIEDRSNSHIERVTTRLQAQLHESNI